jgi:anti-sigma factor RsiW
MNSIEEILWNYIDGNCSADEQQAITELIAKDEAYRLKYQELMSFNKEFMAIEIDEPPMAFTYNVMEAIRTEHAQQPLKAAINNRIIMGIAAFFVLTIVALLGYALLHVSLTSASQTAAPVSNYKIPELKSFISKPVMQVFFFFDVVLGLFLFDTYLRRKKVQKEIQ